MAIVLKNLYQPGKNLTNLALNTDLNRFTDDKTYIEIDNAASPATITIKVGSLIEVLGNLYAIEGSDVSFVASSAAHLFIGFDGTTFTSQSTAGTFDPEKGGYYQADNVTRTLKWMLDQANELYSKKQLFSARRAGSTTGLTEGATIVFETELYDIPGVYSGGTFTAEFDGFYRFHLQQNAYNNVVAGGTTWTIQMRLRKNSTTTVAVTNIAAGTGPSAGPGVKMECTQELYLVAGDTIEAQTFNLFIGGGASGVGSTITGDTLASSEYSQFNGNQIDDNSL